MLLFEEKFQDLSISEILQIARGADSQRAIGIVEANLELVQAETGLDLEASLIVSELQRLERVALFSKFLINKSEPTCTNAVG